MWNRARERDPTGDSGAAAVEFALLIPLLVLLLGAVVDFGLAFNTQISLTHAAREGVRVEALGTGDPIATAIAAFDAPAAQIVDPPVLEQACPSTDGARLVVTASTSIFLLSMLPFVDDELALEGQAVMRCNG